MNNKKDMPFNTDEEHKKFLETFESRTDEKSDAKEDSNELMERVRFIEKVIEGMSDDLRMLKSKDRLLRLKDATEKLAKSEREKEDKEGRVFCPVCDIGINPDKRNICPSCGSVYKNGKWIESKFEAYINSDKIGERPCPRCKEVSDWNKVETLGVAVWWAGQHKDCPSCKEKAFMRIAKGWLAMTDEVVEAVKEDEDDENWYGDADRLRNVIDRCKKKQGIKAGEEKEEKEEKDEWSPY